MPSTPTSSADENANINGDTAMGSMLKFGSEGSKQFYEMYVLNPRHAQAHRDGDIHIHDLDFYTLTTTCCQIDLLELFHGGFSTGHGVLREPNDIYSYSALACIAIQANQNDQHGGQSVVNFDYGMAPGVKKTYFKRFRDNLARALELLGNVEDAADVAARILDELEQETGKKPSLAADPDYDRALIEKIAQAMPAASQEVDTRVLDFVREHAEKETDKATYQAMEALIHNLNTMNSRAGAQVPFSSINYGMDTSPEGRMVMRNVLLATEGGPWPTAKRPSSLSRSSASRRASASTPAIPTTTCIVWPSVPAPSASSPISASWTRPSTSSIIRRATPKPKSPTWAAAPA